MATETELKLRIAPRHLARLKRHALLKAHRIAPPVTRKLLNLYFDTPKLGLHKTGMALRLRRAGRQWLQTLKGGGAVQGGLHRRDEWEMPVARAALDFSMPEAVEWEALLPRAWRKKLQPVFSTDFRRSIHLLEWQGAQIELCMDQGEVRAEAGSVPICELELELKSGEPRQLFELALALLEIVPFELEGVSKAERGYRLLSGEEERPVKARAPAFGKDATLAEVLQTLVWSCLAQWQANLHGALEGRDAEYLHQMRVALRRLRVVLRMAVKLRPDAELEGLVAEVAVLCNALGRIRELDVFGADILQPMLLNLPDATDVRMLQEALRQRCEAGYAALRSEASARDMQRLMLRLACWMHGTYWRQAAEDAPAASGFALKHLRRLAKRFARARRLDGDDAASLHALRILAKKLRYSAEFFQTLHGGKRAASYISSLAAVQDVLGRLNDLSVAERLLGELETPSLHDVVLRARGWVEHARAQQLAALPAALKRFEGCRVFPVRGKG